MTETDFDLPSFLAGLPAKPGVYRMLDAEGKVLYVGKARQLRNRVRSRTPRICVQTMSPFHRLPLIPAKAVWSLVPDITR